MNPSLSEWLALRQRADFAARSVALTQAVADRLRLVRPLRVLDLGGGTGSNIRYLAPALGRDQHWLITDKDARLLAEAAAHAAVAVPDVQVETRAMNLGKLDAPEIFDGRHLVTASALLDLVSDEWLRRVAAECRRVGACALFTITYNGRNECTPGDPDDAAVFDLFNRHQLTDKGLGGAAAGPRATVVARRCFVDAGFAVRVESSDWRIGPDEREFQRQLIEGWADAAAEMSTVNDRRRHYISDWLQRRLAHVDAGRSRIIVGHDDMLCSPR
jgi:hypothetical protein